MDVAERRKSAAPTDNELRSLLISKGCGKILSRTSSIFFSLGVSRGDISLSAWDDGGHEGWEELVPVVGCFTVKHPVDRMEQLASDSDERLQCRVRNYLS